MLRASVYRYVLNCSQTEAAIDICHPYLEPESVALYNEKEFREIVKAVICDLRTPQSIIVAMRGRQAYIDSKTICLYSTYNMQRGTVNHGLPRQNNGCC